MSPDIPYSNPLVRDLDWALSSPPLLVRNDAGIHWPDGNWYRNIAVDYRDRLRALDRDPDPLLEATRAGNDRRLGKYFESLWHFWLSDNPRYRLLHANVPVRDSERTLGEFDLLVEDLDSGRRMHWELALKFYLGSGDTRRPGNWWGPARRDRLDIKTRRMLDHQGRLSQQSEGAGLLKELGIDVDETWLIMKGRLFYPRGSAVPPPDDAAPEHPRGFWSTQAEFLRDNADSLSQWTIVQRRHWLAPLPGSAQSQPQEDTLLSGHELNKPLSHPLCVARLAPDRELERGFIVADDWQETDV